MGVNEQDLQSDSLPVESFPGYASHAKRFTAGNQQTKSRPSMTDGRLSEPAGNP
jgi:hypothetical protein